MLGVVTIGWGIFLKSYQRKWCLAQLLLWLEAFVDAFDLRPLISFGSRVVDIAPLSNPIANTGQRSCKDAQALQQHPQPQWVVTTEPAACATGQVSGSATPPSWPIFDVLEC